VVGVDYPVHFVADHCAPLRRLALFGATIPVDTSLQSSKW